jgi:glycosyltransferase involved in cell wall biosynthesis
LGINNNVIFTGYRCDIPELMSALDILVSASWAEPFGLVVIEAMAAAKPVIGTKSGGIPEIVLDNKTGRLVPPHDPDSLANAIIEIAQDAELMEAMGRSGRQRAEEVYSSELWIRRITSVFEDVFGALSASPSAK